MSLKASSFFSELESGTAGRQRDVVYLLIDALYGNDKLLFVVTEQVHYL